MTRKKKIIIILSAIICFSLIGLFFTLAYEKEMKKVNEAKEQKIKIEDNYFEKAEKLGIEEDRFLLNSITRNIKKINNQDRVFKLASSMVSEYNYLINTQQLDKAYEMLDSDYINEFKVDYNIFQAKHKGEKIKKYVITYIEEMKTEGIILVEYIIERENGFIKENMSIVENDGEYALTLNGLTEKTTMEVIYEVEGIKIYIPKRYKIANSVAYKMIIENTTNKDIKIKNYPNGFYGVIQDQKYSHRIINSTTPYFLEDYILKQGEIKEYIVKFNTSYYLEEIRIELENNKIIDIPIYNNI